MRAERLLVRGDGVNTSAGHGARADRLGWRPDTNEHRIEAVKVERPTAWPVLPEAQQTPGSPPSRGEW